MVELNLSLTPGLSHTQSSPYNLVIEAHFQAVFVIIQAKSDGLKIAQKCHRIIRIRPVTFKILFPNCQ